MIHSRAEENWLKRKGALRRPKGRTISKNTGLATSSLEVPSRKGGSGCSGRRL